MFGLMGVGWYLSGHYVQAAIRRIGAWVPIVAIMSIVYLVWWALSFLLPYPLDLVIAGLVIVAWPAAIIVDAKQLRIRLEDAEPPPLP